MTNLDLKVLLFFLASYKTLALCGHPVIEKMQKILLYDTLFAFFDEKKLVILASRLRWEEVRAILEGFMNLGHKYSFKSWLCSCEDEFQKNSKLTGPDFGVNWAYFGQNIVGFRVTWNQFSKLSFQAIGDSKLD